MEEQIINLYESDTYIPQIENDVYRVKTGKVSVFLAPVTKGKIGKRILLCEVEENKVIPAFVYKDHDYVDWRFILCASDPAELEVLPGKSTSVLKKNFLKKIGINNAGIENFNDSIVEFYKRESLKDNIFIERGKKSTPGIKEASYEVIQKAFNAEDTPIEGSNAIYKATAAACKAINIPILSNDKISALCGKAPTLPAIANASGFAYREIVLEQGWYVQDAGPFVGFIEDEPVALIPRKQNEYDIYYGNTGVQEHLTKEIADTVNPKVYGISQSLPHGKISKKDLFSFGINCVNKIDIIFIILLGIAGALIGILIPELNQKIYDDYIPLGEYSQIVQICMVILTFMLGNMFFDIVKNLCEFRVGSKVGYSLQNAVYYRIFRLPESFMGKYDSADMAQRLFSINAISTKYVEVILGSGLGLIFSLIYLIKMFKYSSKLALYGLLMIIVYAVIVSVITTRTTKISTKIENLKGEATGKLYQYLNGVDKLRMAGAEDRAVYQYMIPFSQVEASEAKLNLNTTFVSVFATAASTIFTMVFYYLIVKKNLSLSTGKFTAFNSAFGSFVSAFMELVQSAISLYMLKPVYKRIAPIFETAEEGDENSEVPNSLNGDVELKNVKFSYAEGAPNVLDGINLHIHKGEYVGIVGPSGCGKSTLLKLLLGFEEPKEGQILYDGKDFMGLNKREVRKNLGVVLQNGQLISGSIAENITITSPKSTMEDVNKVVEMVGLKADIDKMPMGLQTVLDESSGTISGGQKQRILIARAIINQPSILIFDEATSALDNLTQAQVSESLDKMNSTRIVVAHRLSTIKNCDRILVLKDGKISEEGNYDQLMEKKGLFYQLAIRQIVD